MLQASLQAPPEQESVFLVTTKMIASPLIPESGLVLADTRMTPTRVETMQRTRQIMETNTSKPWDTFWYSEKESDNVLIGNLSDDLLSKT